MVRYESFQYFLKYLLTRGIIHTYNRQSIGFDSKIIIKIHKTPHKEKVANLSIGIIYLSKNLDRSKTIRKKSNTHKRHKSHLRTGKFRYFEI